MLDFNKIFSGHRRITRAFKRAGIDHCDIAPRNVLRDANGTLRFIDFEYSVLKGEKNGILINT